MIVHVITFSFHPESLVPWFTRNIFTSERLWPKVVFIVLSYGLRPFFLSVNNRYSPYNGTADGDHPMTRSLGVFSIVTSDVLLLRTTSLRFFFFLLFTCGSSNAIKIGRLTRVDTSILIRVEYPIQSVSDGKFVRDTVVVHGILNV